MGAFGKGGWLVDTDRPAEAIIADPLDLDTKLTGGKIGDAIGKNNPFKKTNVPKPTGPTAPAAVTAPDPGLQFNKTTGPVAGQIGFTPSQVQLNVPGQFRDTQAGLISQLEAMSRGEGPSLAENQYRQAQEANIAAQRAAMASARGGAGAQAAMARTAAQQGAQIGAQTAIGAGQLRLQEQLAAQQALAGVAQAARAGDIQTAIEQGRLGQAYQDLAGQLAAQQAGFSTQANIAGAEIGSRENLAADQLRMQLAQLQLAASQGNQDAAIRLEQMRSTGELAYIQNQIAAAGQQKQMIGGLISTAGTVGGAMIGGPAGAAAGGQAGNMVGDLTLQEYDSNANAANQYTNYSTMA